MKKKFFPEPVEALILALIVIAGSIIFTLTLYSLFINSFEKDTLQTYITIFFTFVESLFVIIPIYYSVKKGYDVKSLFRFRPVPPAIIIYSILIGISLFVLADEIDRLIRFLVPPSESFKEMLEPITLNNGFEWFLMFVGSVMVSAIAEEGLFRGFLQVTLESKGDPSRAVILTSIAWAIIYPNPYLAIPVFVLGIFIGFVAWKTNSIFSSIIIHASYSAVSLVLISDFLKNNMDWYLIGSHVSPVFIIGAAGGLYLGISSISKY